MLDDLEIEGILKLAKKSRELHGFNDVGGYLNGMTANYFYNFLDTLEIIGAHATYKHVKSLEGIFKDDKVPNCLNERSDQMDAYYLNEESEKEDYKNCKMQKILHEVDLYLLSGDESLEKLLYKYLGLL